MPDQISFLAEQETPCRALVGPFLAIGAIAALATAGLFNLGASEPPPSSTTESTAEIDIPAGFATWLAAQQIADALLNDSLGTLRATNTEASADLICTAETKSEMFHEATKATSGPTGDPGILVADSGADEPHAHIATVAKEISEALEDDFDATTSKVARFVEHTVEKGDTLSRIFADIGLSPSLLAKLLETEENAKQASRLVPGQKLRFALSAEGELLKLIIHRDAIHAVEIAAEGDRFRITRHRAPLERKVNEAFGIIETSLFAAAVEAGLPQRIAVELAELFASDIDFSLDIRSGDLFTVIYETSYLDGEEVQHGPILAAEFVNHGVPHRIVRYTDPIQHTDYYHPDGRNIRRALLRSPVKFTQITSGFSKARWHPILHRVRAHTGVDYAAPIGTPVRAAGDGTISYRGFKGGYGKTIEIKHSGQKSTVYAHLSKFAEAIDVGKTVRQGQVIGYVGQSGLASGPHLHYEFRVKGRAIDPLTEAVADADPLDERFRSDFSRKTAPWLAELDAATATRLAFLRH